MTVGARFGLWEQFLLVLLPGLLRDAPEISIRAEIGLEAELMQGLIEGHIDIGVMYTPESRPGLKVEHLFDERQVLASELRRAESRGDDTWRSKLADLNSVVRRREGGAG